MEPAEFRQKLTDLQQIIIDGILYFTAWRALSDIDEDIAKALNRYKGLFLPAQLSFKKMALIEFNKIFDKDPRTSSFRILLQEAMKNRELLTPYATDDELLKLKQWLDTNEELLGRLKHFRDKRLAHYDSVYYKQSLLYGEVKKLVDEIQAEYNMLMSWHDRGETVFEDIVKQTENDILEVIEIICQEREKVIKFRQEKYKEIQKKYHID